MQSREQWAGMIAYYGSYSDYTLLFLGTILATSPLIPVVSSDHALVI